MKRGGNLGSEEEVREEGGRDQARQRQNDFLQERAKRGRARRRPGAVPKKTR